MEGRAVIDTGNELITARNGLPPSPVPAEVKPIASAGDPVGQGSDIITPLNVRDPSALVMAPGTAACPPSYAIAPPEPHAIPASKHKLKKEPLPEGRLLDLMKKKDASPDQPKVY